MNEITITGNLVYSPTLRIGNAVPYTFLRVAHTPRYRDFQSGEWKDADSTYIDVICRKSLAENVCESLGKGSAVIVTGRLRMKEREVEVDGHKERRQSYEIDATAIGPDLTKGATQALSRPSAAVTRQQDAAIAEALAGAADPFAPAQPFAPATDFEDQDAA